LAVDLGVKVSVVAYSCCKPRWSKLLWLAVAYTFYSAADQNIRRLTNSAVAARGSSQDGGYLYCAACSSLIGDDGILASQREDPRECDVSEIVIVTSNVPARGVGTLFTGAQRL